MRIYFEDGALREPHQLTFKYDFKIDAADGYSANKRDLDLYSEVNPRCVVYTNSLLALRHEYCWDNDTDLYDVFVRNGEHMAFCHIHDAFGRKIWHGADLEVLLFSGRYPRASKPSEPIHANDFKVPNHNVKALTKVGFSSHDCESIYECPHCEKTFGDRLLIERDGHQYCPFCKQEVRIIV